MNHGGDNTNPIFNNRKLKLGTFGTNLKGGCSITSGEGALAGDWKSALEVAKLADEMELEAIVPVGRFRGFGGETDYGGTSFEAYTFAAGIAAQTNYSAVFSTSHVPTIGPVMAAKQAATVDHISGGRFVLNLVTGWHKTEMEMFGAAMLDHDTRYDVAVEWIEIIKQLWERDEPLNYEGKFYHIKDALLKPRPIQRPRPPVMCAGQSPKGKHFAAKYCDIAFTSFEKLGVLPDMQRIVEDFRRTAREEYGRELRMWSIAYIVQGDTEEEARKMYNYYVREKGDFVAATNLMTINSVHSEGWSANAIRERLEDTIGGFGSYPLIGTPEQITDGLQLLSDAGIEGVILSWPNYKSGMEQFQQKTVPLLKQADLR